MNLMNIAKKVFFGQWRTDITPHEGAYVIRTKGHRGLVNFLNFQVVPPLSYWGKDGRRAVHPAFLRYDQYHEWEPFSEVINNPNYLFESEEEAKMFLSESRDERLQRASELKALHRG